METSETLIMVPREEEEPTLTDSQSEGVVSSGASSLLQVQVNVGASSGQLTHKHTLIPGSAPLFSDGLLR